MSEIKSFAKLKAASGDFWPFGDQLSDILSCYSDGDGNYGLLTHPASSPGLFRAFQLNKAACCDWNLWGIKPKQLAKRG